MHVDGPPKGVGPPGRKTQDAKYKAHEAVERGHNPLLCKLLAGHFRDRAQVAVTSCLGVLQHRICALASRIAAKMSEHAAAVCGLTCTLILGKPDLARGFQE